jgi:hypothetical protein
MRWSTSGWRRQVPVAVQGASSRIASNGASGSQAARRRDHEALRPVRARLSRSSSSRRFADVERGDLPAGAASCSVLPPGAAHRSSTRRPSPAPSSRAGRLRRDPAPTRRLRRSRRGSRPRRRAAGAHGPASARRRPARRPVGGGAGRAASGRAAGRGEAGAMAAERVAPARGHAKRAGSAHRAGARRVSTSAENTPCASRRGPPASSGRPVAITACGGVSSRSHCASISRSTMRGLASSGRRCGWRCRSARRDRSASAGPRPQWRGPARGPAALDAAQRRACAPVASRPGAASRPGGSTASSRRSAARRAGQVDTEDNDEQDQVFGHATTVRRGSVTPSPPARGGPGLRACRSPPACR